MRTLSKSDFKAARTCPAKLYYRESRYPDTRADDPYLAMLAEGGYMVEALAKAQRPDGITLEYGRDPAASFERTMELLQRDRVTLFEATLLVGRRLARVDILEKDGTTLRLIEVKAKSFDGNEARGEVFRGRNGIRSDWREYLEDVTYQSILLRGLFPDAEIQPYLLLVDKSKRAQLDAIPTLFEIIRQPQADGTQRVATARFTGPAAALPSLDLLTQLSVAEEVDELTEEVEQAARLFDASLDPLTRMPPVLGAGCRDCEYRTTGADGRNGFRECWGELADVTPHVLDLYQGSRVKGLVESMVGLGKASLLDVDESLLVTKKGAPGKLDVRRLLQIRHTRSNQPHFGETLGRELSTVTYPLHYVDFETSRLALPYHTDMPPYGLVAFQWSCHTVASPGSELVHSEWLNDVDIWPNADFARSLRAQIGDTGTILTWSKHEGTTMKQVGESLARFGHDDSSLADWLTASAQGRILDLNALTLADFFHPGMGGRTSIKVVLDTLWKADSAMRDQFEGWVGVPGDADRGPYASLPPVEIGGVPQDVHEGMGAMRAYQEMMYGEHRHDPDAKAGWSKLLRQYCKLDTLAMVLIWEYWRRNVAA